MRTILIGLTLILMGSLCQNATANTQTTLNNWEVLGKKAVDFRLDTDVIPVGKKDGAFTHVQLRVKGGSINLHKFTIHYKNGTKQEVSVRKNFNPGGKTREIALNGNNRRIITKIVLKYDKEKRNKPTYVEVWGKHYETLWDELGKRSVNFRLDRDVITVGKTEGRYNAVQLRVKGGPINLHRFIIKFSNGTQQDVSVRKNINGGGKTREVQLKGNPRRFIKEVVLVYDKDLKAKPSAVSVWGKRF